MATMILGSTSINMLPATDSEKFLLMNLDANLDETFEVYFRPNINGMRPDIIILKKFGGMFILNIKYWDLKLRHVENKKWIVDDIVQKNPVEQIKNYRDEFMNLYSKNFKEQMINYPNVQYSIQTGLIFMNTTNFDVLTFRKKYFRNKYPQMFGNEFGYDKNFFIKIKECLSYSKIFNNEIYDEFYRLLQPSTYILNKVKFDYSQLSREQEKIFNHCIARKTTKIMGVAGSGKTFLLANLAVKFYELTKQPVLILTYNITLCGYIREQINRVLKNVLKKQSGNDVFEIIHYHAFVHQYYKIRIGEYKSFNDLVYDYVIDNAPFKYQTILVDETQDYHKIWVDSIYKILQNNGSLIFFADEKQSIYAERVTFVEDQGQKRPYTKIRGAWNLMSDGRRGNNEIIELANNFQQRFLHSKYLFEPIKRNLSLQNDETTKKYYYLRSSNNWDNAVNKILEESRRLSNVKKWNDNDICFLSHNANFLREIEDKLLRNGYKTNSTLALKNDINNYINKLREEKKDEKEIQKMKKIFIQGIERPKKFNFNPTNDGVKITTIHSYKGLETKTAILIIVDPYLQNSSKENNQFSYDELIYTAITRARENILIFNLGVNKYHEFFEQYVEKSCWQQPMPRFDITKVIYEEKIQSHSTFTNHSIDDKSDSMGDYELLGFSSSDDPNLGGLDPWTAAGMD